MSTVVVVAPHPDDETLGCGGSILRHCDEGDKVHWLIMTSMTEEGGFKKEDIETRQNEIERVAELYGFTSVKQAGFKTAELDLVAKKKVVQVTSDFFNDVKPDIIYLPFSNDVHSDHQVVFDAVTACTKTFRYPYIKNVRAYETLSETEFSLKVDDGFRPNLWLNISDYLDRKIEIMNVYKGEMGKHPFPRSEKNIRALASFRGAFAGCEASEAFMSLKEII